MGRAAAPVRLVHLGLGSFFRAHQAWYTEHAPDADGWGYAAFSGHSRDLPARLAAQEGLYTLVTRDADGDRFDVIGSLSRAHPADDHAAWLGYFASADLAAVTVTVTEAGYLRRADGGLDVDRPEIRADLAALRAEPAAPVRTAPGRLAAGLLARRRAGAGAVAVVACDNLPGNGAIAQRVVREFAALLDPALPEWLAATVSFVTTTVDRITPRTGSQDTAVVRAATGFDDRCPVVTEPFAEWVLCGAFPAGRPGWDAAGVTVTDDITPFEHRKLWLLNGGHSLLAYAGRLRGHATVAEAVADETCRAWLQEWWELASAHLTQPDDELAEYRTALLQRFANPRIRHTLAQIATDGSQKLPIRVLPVLRGDRDAHRMPEAAARILAAWIGYLRGHPAEVSDVRVPELRTRAAGPLSDAVPRLLDALEPGLGDDADLVATVVARSRQFQSVAGDGP